MDIVGICRFSLLGRGDWISFRGAAEQDIARLVDEQAQKLFDPARIEARLRSFELLTLASLQAQTDQNFVFIVLASTRMPQIYQDRLRALCARVPQVELRFFDTTSAGDAQRKVFKSLGLQFSNVLQFRLDDDDAISQRFVANMRRAAGDFAGSDKPFVITNARALYVAAAGNGQGAYDWPVTFLAAGLALRHPKKSVYEFGHFGMEQRFEHAVVDDNLSLVTHHGLNDTSFSPDRARKRGMQLLAPQAVAEIVADQFSFLSRGALALMHLAAPAAEDTDQSENDEEFVEDSTLTVDEPFIQLYKGRDRYAVKYTQRSFDTLYIGFDNLAEVRSRNKDRPGWGYGFAKSNGWSFMGVLAFDDNWFRSRSLHKSFAKLQAEGFFDQFDRVILSGTSMGGYGACLFAQFAPGCTVVAFSPQSTLDVALAPWDTRYPGGTAQNWSFLPSDAAETCHFAHKAYVFYDPKLPEDRAHAERLVAAGAVGLKMRWSGHMTAQFLRQVGLLSSVSRQCADGTMDEGRFYAAYRPVRLLRRYVRGLADSLLDSRRTGLLPQAFERAIAADFPRIASDFKCGLAFVDVADFDLAHMRAKMHRAKEKHVQSTPAFAAHFATCEALNKSASYIDLAEALEKFAPVLESSADFYVWRANCAAEAGMRAEALADLVRALYLAPMRPFLQRRIARIAQQLGRRDIVALVDRVEALNDPPKAIPQPKA
ncbi:hypothetical protein BVG79_01293 [Ketogulonicigenium robustum]|uniref:Uncharacterized protein n=1 Tax=Ketogulonicigenium robustum TaxID=92947 RepID=A0A1W6NZM4_9RHOB|nr:glycosyltransferase [Ketogulonicigenium robustum]ARO14639.1 hypothetical protein BVG79_01293 [Ketogulonicigenium robustum]